jgi:DNA-directed RNA polymerase subunit RPC12/RpoP
MEQRVDPIRCPVCGSSSLTISEPGQGTPPVIVVIDGESRLLKPIACRTCTSVWFVYGDPELAEAG